MCIIPCQWHPENSFRSSTCTAIINWAVDTRHNSGLHFLRNFEYIVVRSSIKREKKHAVWKIWLETVRRFKISCASSKSRDMRTKQRLLLIMPNPRKMERHFPIKPRQPIGKALATSYQFRSLIRAKNRFVKNRTAHFDRNIPTEISGPPPEVIPNIPDGRDRNGPFHLNFDRNFRNLWHNGKHPESSPAFITSLLQ